MMMSNFKSWICAFVVSFSQLVFSDRVISGILVWLAILFLSPWSALGSLVAVGLAVFIHRFVKIYTREQWELGWSGFNAAIIGIFWGGALADKTASILVLLAAVLLVILLEAIFLYLFNRVQLPILSSPAMVIVICFSLVLSEPGQWYWLGVLAQYWYGLDQYLGVLCLILAMTYMNVAAAGWALTLSLLCFLLLKIAGMDVYTHSAYWALNIPLAVFAVCGIFFSEALQKVCATILVVIAVSIAWVIWSQTQLINWIQPIVIPMILALWFTLIFARKCFTSDYFSIDFWQTFFLIKNAIGKNIPIYLLLTPEGEARILLEKLIADADEDTEQVYRSTEIWEVGLHLKANATPELVSYLRSLDEHPFYKNILELEDVAETNASKAYATADFINCVSCCEAKPWPEVNVWKYAPLCCDACGGLLVPGNLISFLSENYLINRVEKILSKPSLILLLSNSSDNLAENYIHAIDSSSQLNIISICSDVYFNSYENNRDEMNAIIKRRIKRLNRLLKVTERVDGRYRNSLES